MCNKPILLLRGFTDDLARVLPVQVFRYLSHINSSKFPAFPVSDYSKKVYFYLKEKGLADLVVKIPCRKCAGCRQDWSKNFAARAALESRYHEHSAFVTLTYSDDELPIDSNVGFPTLCLKDFQDFMKRLRKSYFKQTGKRIRVLYCGEYGEKSGRPHFHAIIFGYFPLDAKLYYYTDGRRKWSQPFKGAYPVYLSESLSRVWKHGHVFIGEVNYSSCKYVANYQLKGSTNFHPLCVKPFSHVSTRPALARQYYEENLYGQHGLLSDMPLPSGLKLHIQHLKYFDYLIKRDFLEYWEQIKARRIAIAKAVEYDTTLDEFEYLEQRERLMQERMTRKHRD